MYGNGLALMLGAGSLATLLISDPASIGIGLGVLVVVAVGIALHRVHVVRRARRNESTPARARS